MKTIFSAIACSWFILSLTVASYGKDWRGITPMRSTRADVERLLGEPLPPKDGRYVLSKLSSTYVLEDCEVHFLFAEKEGSASVDCLEKIPAGTVLRIHVTPKNQWTLSTLKLDERELRKFDPSDPPDLGYAGYIDETEGWVIRTFKGRVQQIFYLPTAQDRHLCPGLYENQEDLIHIFVCGLVVSLKFDEYGDIAFNDEKVRLDIVALELQKMPNTKVYIIGYAGRKARAGEAQTRANRAKTYLDVERRLAAGRVIAIDGGHREELTLEFYFVPEGAQPPASSPTVDPSEVEIIPEDVKPPTRLAKPLR